MKTLFKTTAIALTLFAFLSASSLFAQEWTKEQKEVWQTVETTWIKWKDKDYDASFANVHEKFLGWNTVTPLPTSKKKWMESMKGIKEMISEASYDIEPARIVVVGDAAVVHYYYQTSFVMTKGEKKKMVNMKGKWAEFYIKEGGKWMMLGDFTASEDED